MEAETRKEEAKKKRTGALTSRADPRFGEIQNGFPSTSSQTYLD
jgi:hypothetical protein